MNKKQQALLHARTDSFRRKLKRSESIILEALKQSRNPYIAFSGGKDSTVVLNLVRSQQDDIPAVWSDDEWWLPETERYIKKVKNVAQIRTRSRHTSWFKCSGDFENTEEYARINKYDLVFMGLREEESTYRRINSRTKGDMYKVKGEELIHCCPIQKWTWLDVWAYIYYNNLDYNKAYDKYDRMSVPPKHQRVGPFAVERVLQYGQLSLLKRGWPELFNKFCLKYPEAENYV